LPIQFTKLLVLKFRSIETARGRGSFAGPQSIAGALTGAATIVEGGLGVAGAHEVGAQTGHISCRRATQEVLHLTDDVLAVGGIAGAIGGRTLTGCVAVGSHVRITSTIIAAIFVYKTLRLRVANIQTTQLLCAGHFAAAAGLVAIFARLVLILISVGLSTVLAN